MQIRMKQISQDDILSLGISPRECCTWIKESFKIKPYSQLPPKISIHQRDSDFFNTMPCALPEEYDCFSVKIVSRIKGNNPSLHSDLFLYRSSTGEMLAHIDADWITKMRTGAVAALAAETFQNSQAKVYSLMGLGSTAHATMECLAPQLDKESCTIRLLKYKNQAERFIQAFASTGLRFEICERIEELIAGADVIISCITQTDKILCPDQSLFKEGVLVIPVHTRGFQNCDLFFDSVFGDDRGHIEGFKYFSRFRFFGEMSDVLLKKIAGRKNDSERILSYNIGLGLHDAYFGYRIYQMLNKS